MSYRSFKKILGETSLERKCLFLFGGGLILLIAGSFYFYGRLNLSLVRSEYNKRADLLIVSNLLVRHLDATQKNEASPVEENAGDAVSEDPVLDSEMETRLRDVFQLAEDLKPVQLREKYWSFLSSDPSRADAVDRPGDQAGYNAWDELTTAIEEMEPNERIQNPPSIYKEDKEKQSYVYFRAVVAEHSCLTCHKHHPDGRKVQAGDMLGVAQIEFPLQDTIQDISRNNAILIAMAIATATLAMIGAYIIIRYVIVKPILHLKDVSDSVAHGDMDQRADIHTGDEFEELSHAFNRMLRHLVTVQDELRQVNTSLDAKVDELAEANLSLHEMNKIKSEFLATMSHELRTPLNSILGFSDLLSDAPNLEERQKKFVANIQTSGRNLLTLINDILDLAKIEAGRMQVHCAELDLSDLIERLAVQMLPLAQRKNIDLQWDVDPEIATLQQDGGKLQQILYNLLSNAVKFTPEGGRISIHARPVDSEMLEIHVADTGIGIPLDDQSRIFEKFRQGNAVPGAQGPLTREFEGTGLGLSIVKELTRLLGGNVSLESEFGKGSTFTVRIPIRHQAPLQTEDDEYRRQTIELTRNAPEVFSASRPFHPPQDRETG